jgi:hypothetical protein
MYFFVFWHCWGGTAAQSDAFSRWGGGFSYFVVASTVAATFVDGESLEQSMELTF